MKCLISLVVLALLAGCESGPAAVNDGSLTPPPYSAEAIRRANPTGTQLVFRVEQPGQPSVLHAMQFVSTSAAGAVIVSEDRTLDGTPIGESERSEATWEELRDHAAFPSDRTTRSLATRDVPAGRFECWAYAVVVELTDEEIEKLGGDPGPVTNRFYFAYDRPGPPVEFTTVHGNTPIMRSVLLRDNRNR
ncbi:MAG: hypothetical protein GY715_08105 [Planctomycetes bacterium]|nr:hypothetical protein [Planctomycetota bacterium]